MSKRKARVVASEEPPPPPRAGAKRGRAAPPAPSGPRLFVRADDEQELQVLPRGALTDESTVAELQAAVETCVRARARVLRAHQR